VLAETTRTGVEREWAELSRRVFQMHAVDRTDRMLLAKAMSPDRCFAWCAELRAGCDCWDMRRGSSPATSSLAAERLARPARATPATPRQSARRPADRTCLPCRWRPPRTRLDTDIRRTWLNTTAREDLALVHLRITLALLDPGQAGCGDDGRVHDAALRQCPEMAGRPRANATQRLPRLT